MQTIPATEAKNRFGGVLRQLAQTGEPILIQRDGKPVAVLIDVEDYETLSGKSVSPSTIELARSAFGMWRDRDDIDDDWLEEGRKNWRSAWNKDDDSI